MRLSIDFSDIDIGDWVCWDGEETSVPELTEIFKREILSAIVDRLMTKDVTTYVRETLFSPVHNAVNEYIRSGALAEAVSNAIKAKTEYGTALVYWDSYYSRVEEAVNNILKPYAEKFDTEMKHAIDLRIKSVITEIINDYYQNDKMSQYIDKHKLTRFTVEKLKEITGISAEEE